MDKFDKDYYENGVNTGVSCYENYRWIPEMTIPMAHNLAIGLGLSKDDKILDYGCAKGYLVKALTLLGYDAKGVDVSKYAIDQAPKDIDVRHIEGVHDIKDYYHMIISKDVFEHIPYEEIDNTIKVLKGLSASLFVCVPLGENGKYRAPKDNLDKTHIICEDGPWWVNKFMECGYDNVEFQCRMDGVKDHVSHISKAVGFIKGVSNG